MATIINVEYDNHYFHCGEHWIDSHDCMCNDRCPVCRAEIEPYMSVELETGDVINHADIETDSATLAS